MKLPIGVCAGDDEDDDDDGNVCITPQSYLGCVFSWASTV